MNSQVVSLAWMTLWSLRLIWPNSLPLSPPTTIKREPRFHLKCLLLLPLPFSEWNLISQAKIPVFIFRSSFPSIYPIPSINTFIRPASNRCPKSVCLSAPLPPPLWPKPLTPASQAPNRSPVPFCGPICPSFTQAPECHPQHPPPFPERAPPGTPPYMATRLPQLLLVVPARGEHMMQI